jgi:hypothetical protein
MCPMRIKEAVHRGKPSRFGRVDLDGRRLPDTSPSYIFRRNDLQG